jgi:hypothetical protein
MKLYSVEPVHVGDLMGTGSFRLELDDASTEDVIHFVNDYLRAEYAANHATWLETPEFPTNEYIQKYRQRLEEDGGYTEREVESMLDSYASEMIREPTFPKFTELTWDDIRTKFDVQNLDWVRVVTDEPVADPHDIFYKWYMENVCFVITQ